MTRDWSAGLGSIFGLCWLRLSWSFSLPRQRRWVVIGLSHSIQGRTGDEVDLAFLPCFLGELLHQAESPVFSVTDRPGMSSSRIAHFKMLLP